MVVPWVSPAVLTPIFMSPTHAPYGAKQQGDINALGGQARQARPRIEVADVQRRQEAPAAVDLRVVAVDLGHDQEHGAEEQRDGKARDERVRLGVELQQALTARKDIEQLLGEGIELREVGRHRLGVVGALLERAHEGHRHH